MSFWSTFGLAIEPRIDQLLSDRGADCTLEDLMNESEIIQEAKGLNRKLTDLYPCYTRAASLPRSFARSFLGAFALLVHCLPRAALLSHPAGRLLAQRRSLTRIAQLA